MARPGAAFLCARGPGDIGIPNPSLPPLPASAVEFWDCRTGIELVSPSNPAVQSCTGRLRNTKLSAPSAPQRPSYETDPGGYWKGQRVLRFAGAQQLNATGLADLTASATRPHTYQVLRFLNTNDQIMVAFANAVPISTYPAGCVWQQNANKITSNWFTLPLAESAVVSVLAPMRIEGLIKASNGAIAVRVNGVETTANTGQQTAGATKAVVFGANSNNKYASGYLACVLLCSAEASAGEITALNSWVATELGA